MKSKRRSMLALAFALAFASAFGVHAEDPGPPSAETPEVEQIHPAEIEKLKEEASAYRLQNEWQGVWSRRLSPLLSLVGGLIAAGFAFWAGNTLNRTQERKVYQDILLGRERHNLELFKSLGDPDPRVRVGAASVLVPRLMELAPRVLASPDGSPDSAEKREFDSIIKVLIAVSKHEEKDELQKYIADQLVEVLGAQPAEDAKDSRPAGKSPLSDYDFQGAKLTNAWWARANLSEVDFYRATLARAGLANAWLEGAILKHAILTSAVLRGCHLKGANLDAAQLAGADMRKADLREARLREADLRGADLREADLTGADLTGADLRGAKLEDVIWEGAILEGVSRDEAAPAPGSAG